MAGVFPDSGLGANLSAWLTGLGALTIKLARNAVTITRATVLADLIEANFSGYAAQAVGAWGAPVYDAANHRYSSTAPTNTWTNSTGAVGNTIYAVYVIDGSGNLIMVEAARDSGGTPIDMTIAGRLYGYTPVFDDSSRASTSP
jgi:hypothetical protein